MEKTKHYINNHTLAPNCIKRPLVDILIFMETRILRVYFGVGYLWYQSSTCTLSVPVFCETAK